MISYTISKYEYYEYSLVDYYEIKKAFSKIFADHDATPGVILITSLGILKLLEDEYKNAEYKSSFLIGQDNHNYIVRFFDREIEDLKDEIRQGFNTSWHDEYRDWLQTLNKIRQRLINKAPVVNKWKYFLYVSL